MACDGFNHELMMKPLTSFLKSLLRHVTEFVQPGCTIEILPVQAFATFTKGLNALPDVPKEQRNRQPTRRRDSKSEP